MASSRRQKVACRSSSNLAYAERFFSNSSAFLQEYDERFFSVNSVGNEITENELNSAMNNTVE